MKKQSGILSTIAFVVVIVSGILAAVANYLAIKDHSNRIF